jgi:glycerol-3-phosphate acyltransferase PlsX
LSISIAIDVMGGDHGLEVTIPAALKVLEQNADVRLILVGPEDRIQSHLGRYQQDDNLRIHHASQVVEMDESAAKALRGKKDSSMRVAINLVKDGEAEACVSAGNTGALMATARFVLKTLPNIDRPAICSALPRANGHVHVLDLGANVNVPAEMLYQFGVMGTTLVAALENRTRPTVGLLNIGAEDIKGGDLLKKAAELFKSSDLNYCGFVEGDDIFNGTVDVVVCDGFSGNVALKTGEGLAQMMTGILREEFGRNWLTRAAGLMSMPVLNSLKKRVDHRRYNGASLVGLRGLVVKSHGSTDIVGFAKAIEVAIAEARGDMVAHLQQELEKLH